MSNAVATAAAVRVLLIEDEPSLQTMTRIAIRKAIPDAEVEIVDCASDAIEAIVRAVPVLIVSDYDLADGSKGDEVLAFLTAVAPELLSRFIFVSGNAVCEEIHSRTMMKPYSPKLLGATLREMLA